MKRIVLVLILLGLTGTLRAEVVRLRDGRLLQGKIVSHSGLEVVIHRWDTGGDVTIPFKEMLPTDRERIEKKLGYRSLKGMVRMEKASRLTLKTGKRVIGIIDEKRSNPKTIVLIRRGISYRYDRSHALRIDPVEVAAGEVYTAKAIYDKELQKLASDSPRGHFELARYAESLGLYEEALVHYQKAQELKPEDWKIRTDAAIARLGKLIENKEAMMAYRSVISANARKEFDQARQLVVDLYQKYTDVEFPKDQAALDTMIDTDEKAFLNRQVLRYMYVTARSLAWEQARKANSTVDEALQYGQGQLHKDLLAKLATKIKAEDKKILTAFAERATKNTRKLNLGSASFLLSSGGGGGSSSAGGGYTVKIGGQTITIPKGATGGRGGRGGGGNQQGQKKKVDPRKSWWMRADLSARRGLIFAAWVQKNLEVVREDRVTCSGCSGKGVKDVYSSNGRVQQTCGRCQGVQWDRVLVYK